MIDDVVAALAADRALDPLRDAVRRAADWKARLSAIRALYAKHIELGVDPTEDPYSLGLNATFTPIETALWSDIRCTQRAQFVPQYPAGRFFLDFADPVHKIAIEADGKPFHDRQKDTLRDNELFYVHGWKVFRVTGREALVLHPSPHEFTSEFISAHGERPGESQVSRVARRFYMETSRGVVRAIRDLMIDRQRDGDYLELKVSSLQKHRFADFAVGV